MKIFFIKSNTNIFYKRLNDIELHNDVHDRKLIYQYLKKNIKSKIDDFYLFYDDKNVLNCFLTLKNFIKEEFTKFSINTNFLREQVKYYFLYKKAKIAIGTFHEKQLYGGFLSYIFHLNKVDKVIDHYFYSIPNGKLFVLKAAALLHDIIEDTSFTKKELRNDFGNEIADIVIAVTKNSFEKLKIFENFYYKKVAKNKLAIYVKVADKIINGKQTLKDKKPKNIKNSIKNFESFKKICYNNFDNEAMKNRLDSIIERIKRLNKENY